MAILFFAATLSFDDVPDAGDVPEGAIDITSDQRRALLAGQTDGKKIAADENGYPILVDRPVPARDFLSEAVAETARLRAFADYAITPLQYAVDLDEATAAELASLKAWKTYYVQLNRVPSQAGYPELINWPNLPA
jgi:hypothetical protein